MKVWAGGGDDPWRIELETDSFSKEEGLVVSLYVENVRGTKGREDESGLAALSPAEAREVAAELLRLARQRRDGNERRTVEPKRANTGLPHAGLCSFSRTRVGASLRKGAASARNAMRILRDAGTVRSLLVSRDARESKSARCGSGQRHGDVPMSHGPECRTVTIGPWEKQA